MPSNADDIKAAITAFLKANKTLPTCFGQLDVTGPLLGQGGNGLVYPIAFEGPAVAKILTEAVGDAPSRTLKRFQREFTRLARTPQHKNLIRLFHYDVVCLGEVRVPVIIMEQCDKSLKKHVQDTERLPVDELRKLFLELCGALNHIHRHGIIHRDVKPENILLRSDGTFVLADFGIARFDADIFPGTDLTEKGDRMANVLFSAPEQFEKDVALTPAADIFALGHVLYWCVTQKTFRGTAPQSMASVDQGYQPFDVVVAAMSRQEACSRPQTAKDAYEILSQNSKEREERDRDQRILDALTGFEEVLRSCTPGKRGIVHLTAKSEIDYLLHALANICNTHQLWWTQGHGNDALRSITVLDDERWLLGFTESVVSDCWVSRDAGVDHCFVLIRTEAMPSFGLYGTHEYKDELAGLVNGVYITESEHEDGFARIGGQIVDVQGKSRVRRRYMRPQYFFIATNFNPVLDQQADEVLHKMIESFNAGREVQPELLKGLWKLPIHPVSRKYN